MINVFNFFNKVYEDLSDKNYNNDEDLVLTEEEDALGEAARLMTLMNLFQDDEQYEKYWKTRFFENNQRKYFGASIC